MTTKAPKVKKLISLGGSLAIILPRAILNGLADACAAEENPWMGGEFSEIVLNDDHSITIFPRRFRPFDPDAPKKSRRKPLTKQPQPQRMPAPRAEVAEEDDGEWSREDYLQALLDARAKVHGGVEAQPPE